MGKQIQIPLPISTSELDISGNDLLINLIPRKSKGGKYPFTLIGSPGLEVFLTLPTQPVIGSHQNGDRAWAVTPTKVYEIFDNGTFNELGSVTLSGTVVMEASSLHLVMVDGERGYSVELASGTVTQFVGGGWRPAKTVTFLNQRFYFEAVGTDEFFWTDILSVTIGVSSFATAEGQPDQLNAVLSDHRDLYLFGSASIEVYFPVNNVDQPVQPNTSTFIEKGCPAPYTIVKQDNTIYFVGSDLMVYQMNGYYPQRISDHIVEDSLANTDITDAFAYSYQEKGQLFYVLTIPSQNLTWTYDLFTGSWFKKDSFGIGRHRSNNSILFFGKTLVGDYNNGNIYHMSREFFDDNSDPIVRFFTMPTVDDGRAYFSIGSFELDMNKGIGLNSGPGSDPVAQIRWSKDDGNTWSNWHTMSLGKIGQYSQRVKHNRLGRARSFVMQLRISDPVPIDIGGAYVEFGT